MSTEAERVTELEKAQLCEATSGDALGTVARRLCMDHDRLSSDADALIGALERLTREQSGVLARVRQAMREATVDDMRRVLLPALHPGDLSGEAGEAPRAGTLQELLREVRRWMESDEPGGADIIEAAGPWIEAGCPGLLGADEPPEPLPLVLEHDPDAGCLGCPCQRVLTCRAADLLISSETMAGPAPDWCPLHSAPVTVRRRSRAAAADGTVEP